jgi:myo-inositol-1(or 4)-monophosphatase
MQDLHVCHAVRLMAETGVLPAFLDRLADAASHSIMPHFRAGGSVESKGSNGFDPVTAADRSAEAAMRKLIGETYPDHGIVGEEFGTERPDAEFVWVLDPIDGTRSFITGLPLWGVLIGLTRRGKPVLGMMAQPFTGERFAGDGTRAWYRGSAGAAAMKVRSCPNLGAAALFTTTPALFKGADRAAYDRVEGAVRLARYGTDCYGYCMVAAGQADAVIECGLQPYDIVALIPIIEGAGGQVTDWQDNSAAHGGHVVATGDRRLHAEILARLAG